MSNIPEREWKKLRAIRERALSRFCIRALKRVATQIEGSDLEQEAHESYLAVYRLLDKEDDQLAGLFNDWRRSTAYMTLMKWAKAGIITEEEFLSFDEDTRTRVLSIVKPRFHSD
jgi:hypothetical protein